MNKLLALLLVGLYFLVFLDEWGGRFPGSVWVEAGVIVSLIGLMVRQVSTSRKILVGVAITLGVAVWAFVPDQMSEAMAKGFRSAALIGAYFCALATLQYAANQATSVKKAGLFLASQPPGRRYLSLTFGTQLFSNLLNYGAVSLLGSLATSNAQLEPDPEIRFHRTRRMMLAIQRGFVSVLTWSPLAFSTAIVLAFFPQISWAELALPGLVSSLILAGVGLVLDTIFKPKLANIPKRIPPQGSWALLLPMAYLFLILAALIAVLFSLFDVRIIGIVLIVVPFLSLAWLIQQRRDPAHDTPLISNIGRFFVDVLPTYRSELVLLMMAGFIGAVAAPLAAPLLEGVTGAVSDLPAWVTLIGLMWLIPLFGQVGANPLLIVALLVPLLPAPEVIGASPLSIGVALTCGWALSGATSPFTANTVLVARLGGVSPHQVGLRWNGPYALIAGAALSAWVVAVWALTL